MRRPSTKVTEARPVRIFLNSRRVTSMAFSIFFSLSCRIFLTSAISTIKTSEQFRQNPLTNSCPDLRIRHYAADISFFGEIEYDNGQLIIHAKRNGGGIHHL